MLVGGEFLGQDAGKAFYALFNILGVIAAIVVMIVMTRKRSKRLYIDKKGQVISFLTTSVCFAVAYFSLFYGSKILGQIKFSGNSPNAVVFVGGVLVFIPVFMLLARFFPRNGDVLSQLENVLPAIAISHVFNRLGCTFNGCCHGIPFKLGILFPSGSPASNMYGEGIRVFPAQPLEGLLVLVCVILILVMMKKGKHTVYMFPLIFGIGGFLNEFFISGNKGIAVLKYFDVPQVAYLLLAAMGVLFYFWVKKEKTESLNEAEIAEVK